MTYDARTYQATIDSTKQSELLLLKDINDNFYLSIF
jgi:hypothetical protein